MDEQLSLDTAAAAAPALRALATEILQAGAAHLGVSPDAAGVLLRRAGGVPAVHVAAAADQLLGHLAAIEGTTVPDQGIAAVLARAGAQLLVSGIELDRACDAAWRPSGERGRFGGGPERCVAGILDPELASRAGRDDLAGPGRCDAEVLRRWIGGSGRGGLWRRCRVRRPAQAGSPAPGRHGDP
jgi:hypothetical protein